MIKAELLRTSSYKKNPSVSTLVVTYPRFILPEVLTHRVFSRNTSSSRARPLSKTIADVVNNPAIPLEFGVNRPGMSAVEKLTGKELLRSEKTWLAARDQAVQFA